MASNIDTTALLKLILNCGSDDNSGALAVSDRNIRPAGHVKMVTAGGERTDLPFHAAVKLDYHRDGAVIQRHREVGPVVRRHRDVGPVDKRRPNVDILVALVDRRDGGEVGDLLAVVGGVDVHPIIVDADFGVGVSGEDGDLNDGGDDNGPDDEDGQEDDEADDEEGGAESAEEFLPLAMVVAADFLRHASGGVGGVWVIEFKNLTLSIPFITSPPPPQEPKVVPSHVSAAVVAGNPSTPQIDFKSPAISSQHERPDQLVPKLIHKKRSFQQINHG
ncbi:hypothetical protein F511_39939 [Dorcoceras hygrometricum]|uniref:Uncharacterized protein n=1 Tax=Dorcoceras hygrometricum TaxID=472368 RepID=A0A2Z7C9C1_9LAMI|nr:hypothetical protein F511_39939 [Dorcoceras hygrometricum]